MRRAVSRRIPEGILSWRASKGEMGKLSGGAAPKCGMVEQKGGVEDSDTK